MMTEYGTELEQQLQAEVDRLNVRVIALDEEITQLKFANEAMDEALGIKRLFQRPVQ